jgi:hypothetical protein
LKGGFNDSAEPTGAPEVIDGLRCAASGARRAGRFSGAYP